MKVKIAKVKAEEEKSIWKLCPMTTKIEDKCFSIIRRTYLWFNNIIIGYRFTATKPCNTSFQADNFDWSDFMKEIESEPIAEMREVKEGFIKE